MFCIQSLTAHRVSHPLVPFLAMSCVLGIHWASETGAKGFDWSPPSSASRLLVEPVARERETRPQPSEGGGNERQSIQVIAELSSELDTLFSLVLSFLRLLFKAPLGRGAMSLEVFFCI